MPDANLNVDMPSIAIKLQSRRSNTMEIELKLALAPRHAARIRRHPLLATIKPVRRKLHSIYFDTPTFDLMQRGIALRLRRVGFHWVQTLKADARAVGAMSSRPEWEMAVAGGASPDFAVLPQEALALLAGIKLKRIAPVFITEFHRTTWQIERGEDKAELALDLGGIYLGEIRAGEAQQSISEVEIELKSGAPEFLFDLAAQLLAQAPLTIEPRSKAERGYLLSGAISPAPVKAARPAVSPQQSASETWNAVMQAALVQLVANVPGFLEQAHNIEYLHQIRIALRRLRAGVTLAKPLGLGVPDWDAALRETMRGLNAARDWDVFLHETLPFSLTMLADTHPEDALLKLVRDEATHTRQQAQVLLHAPAFTQLVLDIGRSLLTPLTFENMPGANLWSAQILEKRWQALRKRCHNFAKLDPAERHMARIAAKKMRYAADAFAPLYGKRSARFIDALAKLQNGLGRSNDAYVGMQLLRALAKKSAPLRFDLGRLDGALEAEVARHAHLSGAIWQRLARTRMFWRT
jgi:inorganic triphosphatase YgiF